MATGDIDNSFWCDKCRRGKPPNKTQHSPENSDPDLYSEMSLDRPRSIRFQFPSRPSISSSESSDSRSSSDDSELYGSDSSATSLSDSSTTSDSGSAPPSASSIRDPPKQPRQHFDPKNWLEKELMKMEVDLTSFRYHSEITCTWRPIYLISIYLTITSFSYSFFAMRDR